jgi:streptogramin lyase
VKGKSSETAVHALVLDGEGGVWAAVGEPIFTGPGLGSGGGELLRISAGGSEEGFRLPRALEPRRLAVGVDGSLWFTAFPTPVKESDPGAIVQRRGGKLWFVESGTDRIGTIAPNGTFGPSRKVLPEGAFDLAVGPEGDVWSASGRGGLLRLTSSGRKVNFGGYPESVVTGSESAIWAASPGTVLCVVRGRTS